MSTVHERGKPNGKAAKPPRPAATLIREASKAENIVMQAIQIDHIHTVVEAMAGLLMCLGYALRDDEVANPEAKPLPDFVHAAFARLDDALRGEQQG